VKAVEPVVILPGFLSSGLMNTIERPADVPRGCQQSRSVYQVWLNIPNIVRLRCFHAQMHVIMTVNPNITYTHNEGTNIRGKDWGGTEGIESLSFWAPNQVEIFRVMVETLVELGWVRGTSLRGAPYDWMFPGWHYEEFGFYDELEALVEETYVSNRNQSVHLIGHSMGTLQLLQFLNSRSQAWKDTYVASYIAITPLYIGAPLAIRAILTGVTDIPLVRWYIQTLIRYWGSLHWFNPVPRWTDVPFVSTPDRDYYQHQLGDVYRDAGYPDIAQVYQLAYEQTNKLVHAGVPTHCFVVSGYLTDVSFNYTEGLDNRMRKRPVIHKEDGDGLVPVRSSHSCLEFNPQPDTFVDYPESNHVGILNDPRLLDDLITIVSGGSVRSTHVKKN